MAETVLCGVIRVSGKPSRLPVLRRELQDVVPFVYLSRRADSSPADEGNLPIIEDRFEKHAPFANGLHSSLRILRQPILYLSTCAAERTKTNRLQELVNRWKQCPDRLSGVFFRSHDQFSLRQSPGLYASPLLPGLRKIRSKNGTLSSLLEAEPIRTINKTEAPS